jgi:hypothetical protein
LTDEHKLIRDNSRALGAQALLDNDLFKEAIAEREKQLIEAWVATPARDTEARESLWHGVQANRKHMEYFQSLVNDGKLASAELKTLADIAERKLKFGLL